MKHLIRPNSLASILLLSALLVSCSKEKSSQLTEEPVTAVQLRSGGAIDDDSALQAKVPMIVSSGFLKGGNVPSNMAYSGISAKGRRDATAPTISIKSPQNGTVVSGTVSVTVTASDNIGVASVSLTVDGSAVTSSSVAPFTNIWNSATAANGLHTLSVTARDAAGNKTSVSVQVTVSNVTPGDVTAPVVNITSPGDGTSYDASTTISIGSSASDNIGITSHSLSIDGIVVSSSSASSISYSWNTGTAASGVHTITTTAKDAAGNQSSKTVSVTINTVVIEPTPISGLRLTMPPVLNQGSEGSCVAFAVGYATRSAEQFYRTGASTYSNSTNVFSPEFLYNQIKFSIDCGSGSAMQTALDFVKLNGICTYQSMPYSSTNGCSLLPSATQSSEAASFKIGSYAKMYCTDRAAIQSMIAQKHPVIINVIADNSFINAKPGFIWKTYSGSGSLAHCIVICGYDDAKNAYLVMNSWGTGWGDAGYSWIDYDFFLTRTGTYCYAIN
ncbi:hypothetical protein ESA94_20790 [Lacibacter luteus]|uniref:Peptidase C1A papain C-terminal domain-containing protein n=1 Tax=Lacibacter luteus TaxID=2508719 RepID=A0A4Q1CDF6_9BACT|nr:Ig-like domain-containing protein [Lacibacter luteus]RXK57638.1 hypothetical protein ESA94_20790 [Lacibacter luteus]